MLVGESLERLRAVDVSGDAEREGKKSAYLARAEALSRDVERSAELLPVVDVDGMDRRDAAIEALRVAVGIDADALDRKTVEVAVGEDEALAVVEEMLAAWTGAKRATRERAEAECSTMSSIRASIMREDLASCAASLDEAERELAAGIAEKLRALDADDGTDQDRYEQLDGELDGEFVQPKREAVRTLRRRLLEAARGYLPESDWPAGGSPFARAYELARQLD